MGPDFSCLIFSRFSSPPSPTDLLLEVSSLLLINQDQVEIVAHRELLVDVPHCRRQLVTTEEQPNWDGLAWKKFAQDNNTENCVDNF